LYDRIKEGMYAEEIAFASQEPTNSRSDVVLVGLSWWGRGEKRDPGCSYC
jgi:hypothetical protein